MVDMSAHEVKPPTEDDSQTLQNIADWLSPTGYGPYQSHLERITAPGSASTVLHSQEYQEWVQRPGQTLHLRGSLGVGKTVTTSAIGHDLQTNLAANKQLPVAFIYCGYHGNERSATQLLRSILKQLVLAQSHVPQNVEELYDSHKTGSLPGYTDVFRVLSAVVAEYPRVFIAIDGLFETYMSQNDCDRLLQSLATLQASSNLNVLLTGEVDDSQSCIWTDGVSIDIRAQDNDIYAYFEMQKPRLPQAILKDKKLQQQIKQAMVEVAEGRFLMASLYLNLFAKPAYMQNIHDRLDIDIWRAKDYNDIYRDLIELIATSAYEERTVANTLLLWLTLTNQSLSTLDLQDLLDLQLSGGSTLLYDFTADHIVSLCSGLVIMNQETGRVGFVHPTAMPYLFDRRMELFPDGDSRIIQVCLKYMTYVLTGTISPPFPVDTRSVSKTLYQYSRWNWGLHAWHSTVDHTDEIIAFLDNTKVLQECKHGTMLSNNHPEYAQATSYGFTKLHVAALYDLTRTVDILLQRQGAIGKSLVNKATDFSFRYDSFLDAPDVFGRTPLSFAAERGHSEIVSILLAAGAHVDSLDRNSRTPLMLAAQGGHIETTEVLLTARAYINAQDSAGRSPLSWAAASGHGEMIRFLLRRGALLDIPSWTHKSFLSPLLRRFHAVYPDVTDESITGTPIIRAACNGHDGVVQMLIDEDADPDETDRDGRTGLSWAAANGHGSTAQLLLDHKAKVDAIDSTGRTALSWAAGNGHIPIAQLLIRAGSILETRDSKGRTPAQWAASTGQKGILQLLFDIHADLMSRDNQGLSSFLLASISGHRATVEWLLSVPGISLEDRDNTGRTALSWAVGNGSVAMVESLLDKGVSVDTKDNAGLTTLSWAARRGHCHMIQLLFKNGGQALLQEIDNSKKTALHWAAQKGHADALQNLISEDKHGLLHKQDKDGITPLSLAAENGHQAAAEVILATEPVRLLERKNTLGQTPLMLAVCGGHEELVRLLLEYGSTANTRDISGDVPLTMAISQHSTTMVELLLTYGADLNIRLAQGRTPLSMAISQTSIFMVELLLTYGADINTRLNHGRTAFMLAVERGSCSLVRLLLSHGAEIDTRDNRGQSALFIAVRKSDSRMVRLLMHGGALVTMRDNQGATPVSIANGLGERGAEVRELLMASERDSPHIDFSDSDFSELKDI